jgi:hypothetical protein
MEPLWSYSDYTRHLGHPNHVVRGWALNAIEKRYPRRFTREVADLIGDPNEALACAAPRYLAAHQAVEFAPRILASFHQDSGMVPANCAMALGDMCYEPAAGVMLNQVLQCDELNTLLGIIHYLGKVRLDRCRAALRRLLNRKREPMLFEALSAAVLEHRHPTDIRLVLNHYFETDGPEYTSSRFFNTIADTVGASGIYEDLTCCGDDEILLSPSETLAQLIDKNPDLQVDNALLKEVGETIARGRYVDLVTKLLQAAKAFVRKRYGGTSPPNFLNECYEKDCLALAWLREISGRPSIWQGRGRFDEVIGNWAAVVLSCYGSIHERGCYLKALHPQATPAELLAALRHCGMDLPRIAQDQIAALVPTEDIKAVLADGLDTWGAVWSVRLMGRRGDQTLIPDLVRIVQEADDMSCVSSEAFSALNSIDESGHDLVLNHIRRGDIKESLDAFCLLEHLPYRESYDLAMHYWKKAQKDPELLEFFGVCLEGIGDRRGIKILQKLFSGETVRGIGDSLEVLAVLYDEPIPELATIRRLRMADAKRCHKPGSMLSDVAAACGCEDLLNNGIIELQSVGSDTPQTDNRSLYPCGSGKK